MANASIVPFSFAHLLRRLDGPSYIDRNKEAIVFKDQRITYQQLRDRSARLTTALYSAGVRRGDRVAILMRNDPCYFDTLFAVAALGAALVPVNFLLKPTEIAFILNDSGATTLVVGADLADNAETSLKECPDVKRLYVAGGTMPGATPFEPFRDAAEAKWPEVSIGMEDVALLQYTSGTTGFPKGATHTVSTILWNSFHQISDFDINRNERYLALPALCWAAGTHDFVMATLWAGGTVVLNPTGGLTMPDLFGIVQRERCSRALVVPTVLKQFVDSPDIGNYDLTSLQYVLSGAEPVPVPVIQKFQKVLPSAALIQGYGLSEGPTLVTLLRAEDAVRKIGSCGKPTTNTELRVVDDEDRDVPPGTTGEVIVRSPATMVGYWKREEATAETLRNQWLHTGDLGVLDDEGYLTINGRKKDMIISGGLNVYPAEIEAVMLAHEGVAECAVVGVPDEKWGESARAVAVLRPGATVDAATLLEMCRAKLATYKVPRDISLWTQALPRTASGKVKKFVVREMLTEKA